MAANLPQTLDAVTRLYEQLRREGFIRYSRTHVRGDRVQCRVRGAVLCGRVLGEVLPESDGRPLRIAVLTDIGDRWVRSFDVRACSSVGDDGCACARDAAAALAQAQPRRFRSPLGNTGVAA